MLGECDEIWHAGDSGDLSVAEHLQAWAPLCAVFGNIDGPEVRQRFAEHLHFEREGISIWMTHILTPQVRRQLPNMRISGGLPPPPSPPDRRPDLLVYGHSHILKAQRDKHGVFHLNPGACGRQGSHQVKTMLTMELSERKVSQLKIVDLGPR